MKTKKTLKIIGLVILAGIVIGGSIGLYMFNMPHRDVQSAQVDYSLSSSEIVLEYLTDKTSANEKYLAADGESKILEISGMVSKISEDYNGQKVILLKTPEDKAGVSASFTSETSQSTEGIKIGQTITVKGVIRSGASYDDDLELYENVILEKSNVTTK